ncbi:hypothetical protein [Dactylosporangium sp. NPDC051541]|uniref:hypothetical protein n=1 Tax=Dactylosporangium sp. NPDC051541 TaxID=3363977 RepID=UPI0037B5D055
MTGIAARMRAAAETAERAADTLQERDPGTEPAILAGLQFVSDTLMHAAGLLEPPPPPLRPAVQGLVQLAVAAVTGAAILLAVPHPARPAALALALVGCALAGTLAATAVWALWQRRDARAAVPSLEETVEDLRTRIAACAAALDVRRSDVHLEVGQWLERAQSYLDVVEARV